jgi:hypothetical protein
VIDLRWASELKWASMLAQAWASTTAQASMSTLEQEWASMLAQAWASTSGQEWACMRKRLVLCCRSHAHSSLAAPRADVSPGADVDQQWRNPGAATA